MTTFVSSECWLFDRARNETLFITATGNVITIAIMVAVTGLLYDLEKLSSSTTVRKPPDDA